MLSPYLFHLNYVKSKNIIDVKLSLHLINQAPCHIGVWKSDRVALSYEGPDKSLAL
jgi:hypothetical protein